MSRISSFARRSPRIFAGIWFMLATLASAVLTTAAFLLDGMPLTEITVSIALSGIVFPPIAAFLGGAAWGYRIIAPKVPIIGIVATAQGIVAGFISYLFYMPTGVILLANTTYDPAKMDLVELPALALYGLGMLHIPIAIVFGAAGWGLYKLAGREPGAVIIDRESTV